ncbi:MAG TPA: type III PLP-dependent enzyme [Dongiaceae bacterium]|jgi:ornithine decarboxylase|nr:type III PLP-dependent enzyme [Dongiaceae bacterium]
MSDKVEQFLNDRRPATPCLVVDLDVVAEKYRGLTTALPLAEVFYAVKANPAQEVLSRLADLGASFDTASAGEIAQVLSLGVAPERVSSGNTIKKQSDIAWAYARGVKLYAFDSKAELEKIAEAAPGAQVFCRILIDGEGALWPLNRKFGCAPKMAGDLLIQARELGLEPYGVSFHVGSQQMLPGQWDAAVASVKKVFKQVAKAGIDLQMIDLGGGFPSRYNTPVEAIGAYGDAIMNAMTRHFGNDLPRMIVEPGRYMVGDAGVLEAEVVLISTKSYGEDRRWVYLDIGRFGGLAEVEGEGIRYRIRPVREMGTDEGPVVLAGPTCDSADILYDKANYHMPRDLKIGDRVRIFATGAYTTTYSAVNFNGFEPLKAYYI